jgi:single-stranded DNA-binding protein
MRIAHSEKFKQADGKEVETTTWVDVTWNKTDSAILPYLKAGVKVFVRGYLSTRVYSSKKDRQMKAGVSIAATEIELCGGASELVPRQLIDPSDNKIYDVTKWYWIDADTKGMKKEDLRLLIDKAGNEYGMNKAGFVLPKPEETQENPEEQAQS